MEKGSSAWEQLYLLQLKEAVVSQDFENIIAVNYHGDSVSSCGYISAVNSTEGFNCRR